MIPIGSVERFRPCGRRAWIGSVACVLASAATPAAAQSQVWLKQIGSIFSDSCVLASDGSGGIFVGGSASDALAGPSLGSLDVWLGRYDGAGNPIWLTQFGTSGLDGLEGLAEDGVGGVFLGGYSTDALAGPQQGGYDAWLMRRNGANATLWALQIGTNAHDHARALAADGFGGVLVGGTTEGSLGGLHVGLFHSDAWVARYDSDGNPLWMRQFGSQEREDLWAVAGDGLGGAFVAGITWGDLSGLTNGSADAWIARIDAAGTLLWIQQFGTVGWDSALGISADGSGGAYVCGMTSRQLFGPSAGGNDAWYARIDGSGNIVWGRQFGSPGDDIAEDVRAIDLGGGFLTGSTTGALAAGQAGGVDAWFGRFTAAGELDLVHQFGTATTDLGTTILASTANDVFLCGTTLGDLAGPSSAKGGFDGWFARYDVPCSGGVTYCVASATSIPGCKAAIQSSGGPSLWSPNTFSVSSGPIPGGYPGIAIFGTGAAAAQPIGSMGGMLCFFPPILRTKLLAASGSSGVCNGSIQAKFQDFVQAAPALAPGDSVRVQMWARDPGNADGYLLSDALVFTVCP